MTSSRVMWICLMVSICLLKLATPAPLFAEEEGEDDSMNEIDVEGVIDKKIKFEDENPDILDEADNDDEERAGDGKVDIDEETSILEEEISKEIDEEISNEEEAKIDDEHLPPMDEEIPKEIDEETGSGGKDLPDEEEELSAEEEKDVLSEEDINPEEEEEPGAFTKVFRKVKQILGIAK